jgi:hypothetical protein
MLLVLLVLGCGKDPILARAEELQRVEEAARKAATTGAAGTAGTSAGTAGEQVVAVVPEEPSPGIPVEPDPGIPDATGEGAKGTPGVASREPGTLTAGTAEDPAPGVPEEPVPGVAAVPSPAPAGSPMPAWAQDTGQIAGQPEEPEPGIPEEPKPAPPGTPQGVDEEGKAEEAIGPHVTLRGRIDMDVSVQAKIRIDIFDGDHRNRSGPRPSVVQFHELAMPGTFELSIPTSAKRVWLGAYADVNGNNRPDRGEPRGWFPRNPVFLTDAPGAIVIELVQEQVADDLSAEFGG